MRPTGNIGYECNVMLRARCGAVTKGFVAVGCVSRGVRIFLACLRAFCSRGISFAFLFRCPVLPLCVFRCCVVHSSWGWPHCVRRSMCSCAYLVGGVALSGCSRFVSRCCAALAFGRVHAVHIPLGAMEACAQHCYSSMFVYACLNVHARSGAGADEWRIARPGVGLTTGLRPRQSRRASWRCGMLAPGNLSCCSASPPAPYRRAQHRLVAAGHTPAVQQGTSSTSAAPPIRAQPKRQSSKLLRPVLYGAR